MRTVIYVLMKNSNYIKTKALKFIKEEIKFLGLN